MLTRRMLVALAAIAMLSSSTVFAGGGNGGSKADPIIKVKNSSAVPIAAFINPDPAKIAVLAKIAAPTPADVVTAGGVVLLAGEIHPFTVKAGSYTLAAGAAGADPTKAPQVKINTAKGLVYQYQYTTAGTLTTY